MSYWHYTRNILLHRSVFHAVPNMLPSQSCNPCPFAPSSYPQHQHEPHSRQKIGIHQQCRIPFYTRTGSKGTILLVISIRTEDSRDLLFEWPVMNTYPRSMPSMAHVIAHLKPLINHCCGHHQSQNERDI